MGSTKYSLGEAVQNRLNGGKGKQASWADIREIYKAIEQVLNSVLKTDYFKVTMQLGDTVPEGLFVTTYENVPITTWRNTARLLLPCSYIRLPHGLGVKYVGPQNLANNNNDLFAQFIPIPNGHSVLLRGQPMIEGLLGQIGYEVDGMYVIFKDDITQAPYNILEAVVKLVVADFSKSSEYDFLPIPADMEAPVIEQVYQMFSGERPPAKTDDPIAIKANQSSQ